MDPIRSSSGAFKAVQPKAPKPKSKEVRPERDFSSPHFDRDWMLIDLAIGILKMTALHLRK